MLIAFNKGVYSYISEKDSQNCLINWGMGGSFHVYPLFQPEKLSVV